MAQPSTRVERDSLGPVDVPADAYWGAQTQRSLTNFPIGRDRHVWGREVIGALGLVKWAAATTNAELGVLDPAVADSIAEAAEDVIAGRLDDQFPLVVWQTGSGTQTNMNANEVIANLANERSGSGRGANAPVHPNDHVNRGQSSNDVFPTVMHVSLALAVRDRLVPALDGLRSSLVERAAALGSVVVAGRTHLQDATPVTVGQVMGGWVSQLDQARHRIGAAAAGLHELAIGGTAVGTGLNTHPDFAESVADHLASRTGIPFRVTDDHFAALSAHDAVVALSAALRGLAVALTKVANDVRWWSSGPRTGIGELVLPANEPGSSIMPGKVNPTQAEALLMVCAEVIGNDATVAFAGSQGNFQLNVHKPVMLHDTLESIGLLADSCASFDEHCIRGLDLDRDRIAGHLADDLMLVTALNPHIGYDRAAAIAKDAHARGTSLKDAAVASGWVTPDEFDRWVVPMEMTGPADPPEAGQPG